MFGEKPVRQSVIPISSAIERKRFLKISNSIGSAIASAFFIAHRPFALRRACPHRRCENEIPAQSPPSILRRSGLQVLLLPCPEAIPRDDRRLSSTGGLRTTPLACSPAAAAVGPRTRPMQKNIFA